MMSLPLQTTVLNKHLSELMEGLTAKVSGYCYYCTWEYFSRVKH